MPSIERMIWEKFHCKRNDNVPYCGWEARRTVLAELFADLGYTRGAEIGVCKGEYSEVLLKANPKLHLLCIDPWMPYRLRRAEEQTANRVLTEKKLASYGRVTIVPKTSMDAVNDVPEGSLDFVYIDGLHDFVPVMLDIIHWAKRVRVGGIVSGHDYVWGYQTGVVAAVDAYVRGMGILNWYLTSRDREPSWFWVKR